MSVIVTLQAYNEEQNIVPVIEQILDLGYQCIVVDDGSSDSTVQLSEAAGARVISHPVNLGQGHAVLTGFKVGMLHPECEIIIEMDADGQHDPHDLPVLVEKLRSGNVDIVVGSRILGSNQPNVSFLRGRLLPYYTAIVNRLTGYQLTDSMCGMRAFRCSSLKGVAALLDDMLEPQYLAAEMFIRFSRAGLEVDEVPVHVRDRTSGISYKGMFRYGIGVLKAIFRTMIDPKLSTK